MASKVEKRGIAAVVLVYVAWIAVLAWSSISRTVMVACGLLIVLVHQGVRLYWSTKKRNAP
jgi:ABC-type phosphate transport system auxiliary subunit